MGSSDEDERKKRSFNEMFGDDDSDDDDDQVRSAPSTATTADASGLFGSDSESDDDDDSAKRAPPARPSGSSKKEPKAKSSSSSAPAARKPVRDDGADEYDSGEEVTRTKDDDDFIDGEDDLEDVLGEYDQEQQRFEDERPMDDLPSRASKDDEFFEETLKSLKTGRRSKMNLSVQEMEQITQEVLYRMDKAYADDLVSISERRPALEKIKYVDSALRIIRKQQLQPMLLDFDLLSIVKKWIHPLEDGTLPNVGLRTKMLNMISHMPIFKEHLKRSGLGKVVMMLWKHPEETRSNKDLCRDLIERWSRSVFNKTLDFSKLAELEAEKAENASYRRAARRQKKPSPANAGRSNGSDANGGNVFSQEAKDTTLYTGSERAALPQQLRFDFLHRPRPKEELRNNSDAPVKKAVDPDSRKGRLSKRMQEIAKPGKKAKRAIGGLLMGGSRALQKILSSGNVRKSSVNLGLHDELRGSVVHAETEAMESQELPSPVDNSNQQAGNGDDDQLYQPRPATPAAAANSIEASLQKELKALEVRYFRTRLQQEKTADKNGQLRQDMKALRAESLKRQRECDKLRNLIDRIQADKKQLEFQAISNRDYAKKIEQRFFMGTKGQTLGQRNLELTDRVKALEQTIEQKDTDYAIQQRELKDTQSKLQILKRALETRFDELALNGSLHTGILFELARLQDQSANLAAQLSQERKASKLLEAKWQQAQAQAAEVEERLTVREAWIATLDNERLALDEKLASCANDRQTFAFEKATLLKFIQEQAEIKFQLEVQSKQMQDANAVAQAALHEKLETALKEQQRLQQSAHEAHLQSETVRHEYQALSKELQNEQHARQELETRTQDQAEEIQRLQSECRATQQDFLAAKGVCGDLQFALEHRENEIRSLQTHTEELEALAQELRQQLDQKLAEEAALKQAMENSLHDLEMVSKQRNEAAKAMNEAVSISACSLEEQQALESKIESQRKQLEQLKSSKNLLQNAMLEQLSTLRKQLQLERIQRIEAEAKLKRLCSSSWTNGRHHRSDERLTSSQLSDDSTDDQDETPCPLSPPSAASPSRLPGCLANYKRSAEDEQDDESNSSDDCEHDAFEATAVVHYQSDARAEEAAPEVHEQPTPTQRPTPATAPHEAIGHLPAHSPDRSPSPPHRVGEPVPAPLMSESTTCDLSLWELAGGLE